MNSFKNEVKDTPFFIQIPHDKAMAIQHVKKANFELYHADNNKSQWVFKNGSTLPDPYTSVIGSQVFIIKDDSVLAIEEKTRKGLLCFPAGMAEFGELPRMTAVREVKEETGLVIEQDDLELFAIKNRVKVNRFNANGMDYYFKVNGNKVKGILKPNSQEIIRTVWAPLKDIALGKDIDGLSNTESIAIVAQFLIDQRNYSCTKKLLDHRQVRKIESQQDKSDIMTLELLKK